MALETKGAATFNYVDFKRRLELENFTRDQCGPLYLRLDLLESFMEGDFVDEPTGRATSTSTKSSLAKGKAPRKTKEIKTVGPEALAGRPGELKIIDLTDPVVDSDSACVLFDICLAIFLEKTQCSKVVALDEAHNVSPHISQRSTINSSFFITYNTQPGFKVLYLFTRSRCRTPCTSRL
jgi:hypothetical protein